LLKSWHVDLLMTLRLKQLFLAYDKAQDWEPLVRAVKLLYEAGLLRGHKARCFVLIGYPDDTFEKAQKRLQEVCQIGLFPFAMLYRDHTGKYDRGWRQFQRSWAAPAAIGAQVKAAIA